MFKIFVLITVSLAAVASVPRSHDIQPKSLSLEEAEVLAYLVPAADQVRKAGCDVTPALQTSAKLDQLNFFTFWLVRTGTKKECNRWPVDIGYFSVNKWTGDVWDDIPRPHRIGSPTLDGVLKIIRHEAGISAAIMKRYSSLTPPI